MNLLLPPLKPETKKKEARKERAKIKKWTNFTKKMSTKI